MTTELFWLILTLCLAASLWVPFIIGVNTTPSREQVSFSTMPAIANMTPWVQRANRAHLNLLEQAMPFAALVLTAHLLQVHSVITIFAAAAFFWLRLAHMVVMIGDIRQMPIRPILFTAGWLCSLAFAVEILRLG